MSTKLNKNVMREIQPIYDRLSAPELLTRCTQGLTQNQNESLHALIWRKCPKEVFVSRRRIHMAVVNAVSEHNLGITETLRIKANLRRESISENVENMTNRRDDLRKRRSDPTVAEARKSKRQKKKYGQESVPRHDTTPDYAPGMH